MAKRNKYQQQKEELRKKTELGKWMISSLVIPIIIGCVTPFVIARMDKTKEYIYMDNSNLENFSVEEYFPLRVGNYWIYERNVEEDNGEGKVAVYTDKVKSEVIEEYFYNDMKLYVLKGNPFLMESSQTEAQNQEYGYIILGTKVIEVSSSLLPRIVDKIKKGEQFAYDDITELNITFEFPLYEGQRYGELSQILLHDAKNSVYVEKLAPYSERKGNSLVDVSTYLIHERYNSGDSVLTFVPYKGIIEYQYEHRGTVYKMSIRLKESSL